MKSALLTSFLLLISLSAYSQKYISSVESVDLRVEVGNAPSLPHRLMVEYSDGSKSFRQVRWSNSALDVEKAQAHPELSPVGHEYKVQGFIIGDDSTPNGFPVEADVKVVAESAAFSMPVRARTLPLADVSINGDNRLSSNRDMAIAEMLKWDVRQQLYNYRDSYGLSTEGYPKSNGWDSPTTKLKGHGSGHYMSAMAFAYSSSDDEDVKAEILSRLKFMVDGLRECQERTFVYDESLGRYREARDYAPEEKLREMKGIWADFDEYKKDYANYGYGYLNAIPAAHCVLIEMYRPYNNTDWVWAPYYSVHKQLAGLIDIAENVDDKDLSDKAFLIARDMGLWVWNRMHYRTFVQQEGSREERRSRPGNRYEMWNMYIAGEVGGMAESLSRLSEMSNDAQDRSRLLEAANFFDSPAFFDPLSRNIDDIRTRHANQHIPMVTGALRSYRSNDDPYYYRLAENFWQFIQGRYRYAAGGVGNGEMFRQPYSQIASMAGFTTSEINESCCAYNLAKLTKDLNCFDPDNAEYMDYYERLLYNQIVGSVHPHRYMTTYQYSVGLNSSKPWGNRTPQSSCCGGTGAENHVKYQEAAYFVSDDTVWVGLYLPTTAHWEEKSAIIHQECKWPSEYSRITVESGAERFAMKLRVPYWANEKFEIKLNGRRVAKEFKPGTYVEIPMRRWKKKDVLEVIMPFSAHLDFGPDKMELELSPMWAATLMYGPMVMGTTGVESWAQAELSLASDLSDVELLAASEASGTDGNIYTLKHGEMTFYPDYYLDRKATRYFRVEMRDSRNPDMASMVDAGQELLRRNQELVQIANLRIKEASQWAPHAYSRMLKALEEENFAELAAVLNSMRPSHLAEPEDLEKLHQLVARLSAVEEAKQAVEYAEMVIRYVSEGSGTPDMIANAEKSLSAFTD